MMLQLHLHLPLSASADTQDITVAQHDKTRAGFVDTKLLDCRNIDDRRAVNAEKLRGVELAFEIANRGIDKMRFRSTVQLHEVIHRLDPINQAHFQRGRRLSRSDKNPLKIFRRRTRCPCINSDRCLPMLQQCSEPFEILFRSRLFANVRARAITPREIAPGETA